MFDVNEEITKLKNAPGLHLEYNDRPEQKCIYLDSIYSPNSGSGYGTKVMKCLVQLSQEKGYGGRVDLSASHSSHLFYLYMGMLPFEKQIDYVSNNYGLLCKNTLKIFAECENELDLQQLSKSQIECLIFMLSIETKVKKDEITPLMLIENQEFLLNLNNKKCSYLQAKFIPELLNVLRCNIGEKYPDTRAFEAICMTLSEEGKDRWLKAIKDDTPFETFKNFEHLRPYMTQEQIEALDQLLAQNLLAMSSKENSVHEAVTMQVTNPFQTEVSEPSKEKHLKISKSGLSVFNKKQDVKDYMTALCKESPCLIL